LGTLVAVAALVVAIVLFKGRLFPAVVYRHVPPIESVDPNPAAFSAFVEAQKTPASTLPVFDASPLPLPATGKLHPRWRPGPTLALAPLQVKTAIGSPNYYVKIVDWATRNSSAARLIFFVRSGQTAVVNVPGGVYELRYAAGDKWYGEEYLFGPETLYRRADEQFVLRVDGDRVSGFTVELIKQIDGNLKETPIRPSDF